MQLQATDSLNHHANNSSPGRRASRPQRINWSYGLISWLGFAPFLLFCLLFEILPAIMIVQSSFIDTNSGAFTLSNYQKILTQADKLHAFQNSISLALVTALIGTVIGFMAAYGVFNLRNGWLRNVIIGFSSIAANFAGIPLAFAFISTLGSLALSLCCYSSGFTSICITA